MKILTNTETIMEELERATGRTTRLIDNYIQELFQKGEIIVNDHHESRSMHDYLFNRVLMRLIAEHPSLGDIYLERDKQKRLIKIDLSKLHKNRKFSCVFHADLTRDEIMEHIKSDSKIHLYTITPKF